LDTPSRTQTQGKSAEFGNTKEYVKVKKGELTEL